MDDDLNLLITFLSIHDEMVKVCIRIEHGMNNEYWGDGWRYWGDPDVIKEYRKIMPMHVESFCKKILMVEEIFDIKG